LAGTPADWEQADDLRKFWKANGFDEALISEYDVLLSYPNTTNKDNMNQIQIISDTGDIIYESPLYEEILHESENKSNVVPPFNAYSATGTVESVRVNNFDFVCTTCSFIRNVIYIKGGSRISS
jgi:hypothetical protein